MATRKSERPVRADLGASAKQSAPNPDPQRIGSSSLAKALDILEFVGIKGNASLSEVTRHTGLPKSTQLRLIGVLVDLGYLKRTQHGAYSVTLKLWRIGCGAVNYEGVRDEIVPILRALSTETSETALYATYEDGYSVYIEKVDGQHPIRAYAVVGSRAPAYACATGKAQLAWRTADEIDRLAGRAVQFTNATHTEPQAMITAAEETRTLGYAINRGEWHQDVWGIAAPIFDRFGNAVAAVGVSGPRERFESNIAHFAEYVCRAAAEISQRNGAIMATPLPQI